MALLSSCWFLIESFIIPGGSLKWFYLSFYIHPLLLFVCQIFLRLILLKRWISILLFSLVRILSSMGLCVFRFFRYFIIHFFLFITRSTKVQVTEESDSFVLQNSTHNRIVHLYIFSSMRRQIPCQVHIFKVDANNFVEEKGSQDDTVHVNGIMGGNDLHIDRDICNDEDSSSVCISNPSPKNMGLDQDISSSYDSNSDANNALEMKECLQSACSSTLPAKEKEVTDDQINREKPDPFYAKYLERMWWFDVLNYDRTYGIRAILNKELGSPMEFSSKMTKKRVLRSLESDYELIYVAQLCLSWEALRHQHRKVEALGCSASQESIFYNKNVADELQKFQVLLERFMEDERCEGKRVWNYVQGRCLIKSLLQVPEVSVLEDISEEEKREATNGKQVLKVIEECINTFWKFVRTDKKSWWKFRSSLWTNSAVEDPRDLGLFADLGRILQKEELVLKDLKGKKRCWLKRLLVNPCQEREGKEVLFRMIEMKVVSRVLQMSMLSSSQLKWCQIKLHHQRDLKEANVPLFPCS